MRTIFGRPNTHAISIPGPEVDQTVRRDSGIPLLKLLRSKPECFLYCITVISFLGSVPPVTICCNASHGWGMRSSVCRCRNCYRSNSHAVCVTRPKVDQAIMGDGGIPLLELLRSEPECFLHCVAIVSFLSSVPTVAICRGTSHGRSRRSSVCRCWNRYWSNAHTVCVARPEVDQTITGHCRIPLLELLRSESKRLFQLIAGITLLDSEPSVAISWGS